MYLFLPVAVVGYYLIGSRNKRWAVKWIVICSLFFYGWWNPYFLIFLVGSVLFNYVSGLYLRAKPMKWLLLCCIGANLGSIGYFKYAGFLVSIVNDLSGSTFLLGHIVLPLGISFFTFQQISWLIDNYHGKIEILEKGVWEYAQFVTFFPQLIAGPIVHHSEMMPQFFQERNRLVNWQNMAAGVSIFLMGLAKKVVIADLAAPFANTVFNMAKNGKPLLFADAWIGALAYSVQIYYDFSGYADMAIGLALMFNIHLPLNFDSPYKSTSVAEFWRRWHMTLGRFLRDYVYIPLGGNRRGELRSYINLFTTMFICGIWHGAGWTFILWGMLHGVYLVANRLWDSFSPLRLPRLVSIGITTFCVVTAWVLFRAESTNDAWIIIKTMMDVVSPDSLIQVGNEDLIDGLYVIVPAMLMSYLLPNSQELLGKSLKAINPIQPSKNEPSGFLTWSPDLLWTGYMVIISIVSLYCLIEQSNVQEFIYFQF